MKNTVKQLMTGISLAILLTACLFQTGCGTNEQSDLAETEVAPPTSTVSKNEDSKAAAGYSENSTQAVGSASRESPPTQAAETRQQSSDMPLAGGPLMEQLSTGSRPSDSSGADMPAADMQALGGGFFGGEPAEPGPAGSSELERSRGMGMGGSGGLSRRSMPDSQKAASEPSSKSASKESREEETSVVTSEGTPPQGRSMLQKRYRTLESKLAEDKSKRGQTQVVDLQPGEELWVIARSENSDQSKLNRGPGCGCLMATIPDETKQIPIPLKHTSVVGNIDGYIASVNVSQQFHNPYDSKIEASYVFPLPQNAAVNDFVMTVGDRKIRGIIREKEKAKQIYETAKAQGHVASLMTQQRPNIFTQKVANIEPGKQIDIDIQYFNTLRYDDGAYEFVFPMVVGPRFNPSPQDGIGAVARGSNGTSGQATEVSYLAPNERSGHDVSVTVNINAGIQIEDVHCVNHAIETEADSDCVRTVKLAGKDRIANRDFILRYQVASDQVKTAMLTHEDKHGKYFTMMVYPPKSLANVRRSPMEMVFVLDCSGSMKGAPVGQAKAAIRHALQSLDERDTFQIIRFSNKSSQLGPEPLLATTQNVERGLAYLNGLSGTGGTRMIEGIKAALDFPHDEGRFRLVSFMTDGFIGNEQQILTTMNQKLGSSRIFSFGVGSSPNRYLMNRMASLGKGAVAYLSLNDDAVKVVREFNEQISHPAMTDLSIDWGNMNVTDVYPSRLPDLIVGRPVILTGRFSGEPRTVKVNGRVDMETASFDVTVDDEAKAQHEAVAAVWARLKIKDLMLQKAQVPDATEEIESVVTQTALTYNLMSNYTSFVAVDSMTQTEGEFGTTVAVPVSVPDGVKYETTVGGNVTDDR